MKKLLLTIITLSSLSTQANDTYLVQKMQQWTAIPELLQPVVNSLIDKNISSKSFGLPLFVAFPNLAQQIPHIHLGALPTEIRRMPSLEKKLNYAGQMHVKCDGATGMLIEQRQLFGGNKVRKLEFLLADALNQGATTVMTFGCAGSNHALATSVYAHALGLRCICMLKPQPNNDVVRRNLLLHQSVGSELYYYPNNPVRNLATNIHFLDCKECTGKFPYVIPTGGSNYIGALGYVNAAFELKLQIAQGVMPMPDIIVVPAGSVGTISGLLLGLRAANLPIHVIGYSVEPEEMQDEFLIGIQKLFKETCDYACSCDSQFPRCNLSECSFEIVKSQCGAAYGEGTPECFAAIKVMQEAENILLDPVYSAKACAGMFDYVRAHNCEHKTILFWNTFCSDSFADVVNEQDYRALPACFHCYFE